MGPAMALFGIIMVLLLVSRGVFVFPILAAHNYWSKEKLPFRQIVVAWCARMPVQKQTSTFENQEFAMHVIL